MLDSTQFYTDPVTGTKYTSIDSYNQNVKGMALPTTVDPNTAQAISVDRLAPIAPVTIPESLPEANPLPGAAAGATTTNKEIDKYVAEMTPTPTALDKQQQGIIDEIAKLAGQDTGRGEAQLAAEEAAGLPNQKKQLAEINARLLNKVAEATKTNASYDQIIQQIENQPGVSLRAITGQQAQQQKLQLAEARTNATNIGLLQAYAQGLQGNIQAAQESVNRAVDLKYADVESQLKAKQLQLEAIQPLLSKQEKIQAAALDRQYQEQQTRIADEKAKAKNNLNMAVQAGVQTPFVNHNGEFYDARTGQAFAKPEDFFKAAGVKSFAEAYQRGLVTDVNNITLADRNFVAEARAKYPDAGILATDSPAVAAQKIQRSPKYIHESSFTPGTSGFTLNPGDVRYDANGNIVAVGPPKVLAPKPLTEAQAKDVTYAARSEQANAIISQLESDIAKYNPLGFNIQENLEGNKYTRAKASDKIKQLKQAERNFATAVLRRESGAAISKSEFDTVDRQYFPRPGDDAQTLKQKAQNRQTAIDSFKASNPNNASGGSVQMRGPDGQTWDVPPDQIENFKQNGYIQVSFNQVGNTSASQIAAAIKQVESGGNYNAKGGSGEFGAYQILPSTWRGWAKQFLGNANAPMTPSNQDFVAQAQIATLLKQGRTPEQIALIWNGGQPIAKAGINKYGQRYDSGAYAQKVLAALNNRG